MGIAQASWCLGQEGASEPFRLQTRLGYSASVHTQTLSGLSLCHLRHSNRSWQEHYSRDTLVRRARGSYTPRFLGRRRKAAGTAEELVNSLVIRFWAGSRPRLRQCSRRSSVRDYRPDSIGTTKGTKRLVLDSQQAVNDFVDYSLKQACPGASKD